MKLFFDKLRKISIKIFLSLNYSQNNKKMCRKMTNFIDVFVAVTFYIFGDDLMDFDEFNIYMWSV